MRFPIGTTLFLLSAVAQAAVPEIPGFYVTPGSSDGWPRVLGSLGLQQSTLEEARILVLTGTSAATPREWLARLDNGAVLVIEGDSELAGSLGFRAGIRKVRVRAVRDARQPRLSIVWERALRVPWFTLPEDARVFSRACPSGAPVMAGIRRGRGAVLWVAVSPGPEGYERFPFLPQALAELGVRFPFESRRLWAFFDAAYRLRLDPDAFAQRWRDAGIAALHVGAWQFFEPDPAGDQYLRDLIASCHRHNILVYAWLELPHVSDRFWKDHPDWREKTALQADAYVPWRKLMNLFNPDCRRAVVQGVRELMARFDWDGVNLAELYFDGIQGVKNPAEFTPMNADVRREFQLLKGFDPQELFTRYQRDPGKLRAFLDYRAGLAARLQEDWTAEMEKIRLEKPDLDLVLTHVDDRFDPSMRDAIGADAARALTLLDRHQMTVIIEDPATVWNLGPRRYTEIARRYRPLTPHWESVGVDINVVERGERVHPTNQQVGAELLELIRAASESFAQVVFYYEVSILPVDQPFLSPASAIVSRCERQEDSLIIESPHGAGIRWQGPVTLDGSPWPVRDRERVWIPAGKHVLAPASAGPSALLLDFNGVLRTAASLPEGIALAYSASSRALAAFDRKPLQLVLDGQESKLEPIWLDGPEYVIRLPRGEHKALVMFRERRP